MPPNPTVEVFKDRAEAVSDLTGRVQRTGDPAVFTGKYSTVYQGMLDNRKLVRFYGS